jgi:hypothetical protein
MPRSRILALTGAAIAAMASGIPVAGAADLAARPWVYHHVHHTRMVHRDHFAQRSIHTLNTQSRADGHR